MSQIIDGRKLAQAKEAQLARKVATFKNKTGICPKLVCFLPTDNPASKIYLRLKQQASLGVGVKMEIIKLNDKAKIIKLIEQANKDEKIHGIMIQLPLPKNWPILDLIVPDKDVDCLTSVNLNLLRNGQPRFLPAVVKAILEIIKFANYPLAGVKIAIVGQGKLVGEPLTAYLKNIGAKVLVADINTPDLATITKQAEILVVATGQPGLIKEEMVKAGALVIDVGSPKPEVDFDTVKNIAGAITLVPGGVGPLTVACLLENVLSAANYAIIQP